MNSFTILQFEQEPSPALRNKKTFAEINLQAKLIAACAHELNSRLAICNNMQQLITAGKTELQFSKNIIGKASPVNDLPVEVSQVLPPYLLAAYYETHGYSGTNKSTQLKPVDFIFTDTHSEEYCVQSIYRDRLVPAPRPVHGYPQFNIWELLKLRLDEDSFICDINFPEYFSPADIAYRMGSLLTGNLTHPVSAVFNAMVELVNTNFTQSLSAAGQAVLDYAMRNISYGNNSAAVITTYLHHISPIYIHLATEPKRLRWADTLYGIKPLEKLWAVAKTNQCEIRQTLDMLKKITSTNYHAILYDNVNSFDQLNLNELRTLQFLMDINNISFALELFNTCSYELPEPPPVKNYFPPLTLETTAWLRSSQAIVLKKVAPEYWWQTKFPEALRKIYLEDELEKPFLQTRNVIFDIDYSGVSLKLPGLTVDLGKMPNPGLRMIRDFRERETINGLLNLRLPEYPNIVAWKKSNASLSPMDTKQLLFSMLDVGSNISITINDYRGPYSPLSPGYFQGKSNYKIGSGHDLTQVHNSIFSQCTRSIAFFLIHGFMVNEIYYQGTAESYEKCLALQNENGYDRFHAMQLPYLPQVLEEDHSDLYWMINFQKMICLIYSIAVAVYVLNLAINDTPPNQPQAPILPPPEPKPLLLGKAFQRIKLFGSNRRPIPHPPMITGLVSGLQAKSR
jgi:hypothetical protein